MDGIMWRTSPGCVKETVGEKSEVVSLSKSHSPQQITGRLAKHRDCALPHAVRPRIRARGYVYGSKAFVFQKLADAEDVVSVAHRDATAQAVRTHDHAHAHGGFRGIAALRLSDQAALRNTVPHQIIASNPTLAETGIASGAARSDNDRRHTAVEQVESVIEARPQNRRGAPRVFRRAENHDRIRWVDFLQRSGVHNLNCRDHQQRYRSHGGQDQQTKPPAWLRMLVGAFIGHSSAFILKRSSLSEEAGYVFGGNRAFANDAPARGFITEIDDGGRHVPRRIASVNNDVETALELIAHLLRAGALRGAAEVRGRGGDGNGRGRHHCEWNLCIGHTQCDVARIGSHLEW